MSELFPDTDPGQPEEFQQAEETPPLAARFSNPGSTEPDHRHYRREYTTALPFVYPFVEERAGDRRQEDRDRGRRRPPLTLPGFHLNNIQQDAPDVTITTGPLPEVPHRPDELFVGQDPPFPQTSKID